MTQFGHQLAPRLLADAQVDDQQGRLERRDVVERAGQNVGGRDPVAILRTLSPASRAFRRRLVLRAPFLISSAAGFAPRLVFRAQLPDPVVFALLHVIPELRVSSGSVVGATAAEQIYESTEH